jgi:hypothetical protein
MVGAPKPKGPKEATRKLFCDILGAENKVWRRRVAENLKIGSVRQIALSPRLVSVSGIFSAHYRVISHA